MSAYPMDGDRLVGDGGGVTIYQRPDGSRYALDRDGRDTSCASARGRSARRASTRETVPTGCGRAPGRGPRSPWVASRGEPLLEPVVGVGLVVEGGHLDVAGGAVEGDRLGEGLVRLQVEDGDALGASLLLHRNQQAAPQAHAADGGVDPHPLHFRRGVAVQLQGRAAHGAALHGRDQQQAGRRADVVVGRGDAQRRVEAPVAEAAVELGRVRVQAVPGRRLRRVGPDDADGGRGRSPRRAATAPPSPAPRRGSPASCAPGSRRRRARCRS